MSIEKIKELIDIVELVKEYLPDLKKVGNSYRTLCPFHAEKNPSFYIDPKRGIFNCFGCGEGGDIIKFVMKIENITFQEALRKLADKAGIKITFKEDTSEKKLIYDVLTEVAHFYHKYLMSNESATEARNYLKKRGLNDETIKKFLLGYAADGNIIIENFKSKYGFEILYNAGVINFYENTKQPYDYMRNRIIFPIHNKSGRIIAFGGRKLSEQQDIPLYLNTPDTAVFSKGNSLYGFFHAKDSMIKENKVILVEGYMDVLILHQFGIDNTVAPLGTAFTQNQAYLLRRVVENILIVFDSDESGINAAIRSGELALENDLSVKISLLPEKIDPDEYILQYGIEKFKEILEKGYDIVDFRLETIIKRIPPNSSENKIKIIKEILTTLGKIKSHVFLSDSILKICSKISIPEDILRAELKRFRKSKKVPYEPSLTEIGKSTFSIEEEIIIFCLKFPHAKNFIPKDIFSDEKCQKIFLLINSKNDDIIDKLNPDEGKIYRRLLFEANLREYKTPEKTLNTLLKNISIRNLERMRENLKKQINDMFDKKIPFDEEKVRKFNEINSTLKTIKRG